MNPFRTAEFRRLRAEWARRLEESGFEDIETPDGRLRETCLFRRDRWSDVRATAAFEYYRRAGFYLHDGAFLDLGEMEVWALHADGVSVREISRRTGIHYSSVFRRVRRHRKAAGLWIAGAPKRRLASRCDPQSLAT